MSDFVPFEISIEHAKSGFYPHFVEVKAQLQDLLDQGYNRLIIVPRLNAFLVLRPLKPENQVRMLEPKQMVVDIPTNLSTLT